MPIEGSRGAQLAEWQEALKKAKEDKNSSEITRLESAIKQLQDQNQAEWNQILDDAAAKRAVAKNISKRENLEQIQTKISNLESQIQRISALKPEERLGSEALILPLKEELEKYQIALQMVQKIEAEKQKQAAEKLLNEKELLGLKLFKPIKTNIGIFGSSHIRAIKLNFLDPARKQALENLEKQIKASPLNPPEILKLKKEVVRLMQDKALLKPLSFGSEFDFSSTPYRRSESERFRHRLNKVKRNLNIHLYPTYGKYINALEDYVQNLKNAGITSEDKRTIKTIIFKSDRTQKLNIAEKLKDHLIAFEGKGVAEKEKDPNITLEAIAKLIEQNKKATGSPLLHGKGKLDKILKDLKDKISDPKTTRATPEMLAAIKKGALARAAITSNHPFQNEIIRLNKCIEAISSNKADFPGFSYHFTRNGKENLKVATQLRELLVNSGDLSTEKKKILESRVDGMLSTPNLSKDLETILGEVKNRIAIKGSEQPKPQR